MLPAIYLDADLRCVTPADAARGRLGVAFGLPGQPVCRLALSLADAEALARCLKGYIESRGDTQSPMSPLMSSSPKSVPSDGVNT